ncbi:hypothetical protein WN55_00133 [Dufourea novaeangliae]|uniref:Uncharacterized protein n=1 Tax=Dufourea novaeangliae TaxID=178035 RepID=A0A154PCA3_DUFNO|nr:hypothetical protein WN55_00133 [Dufourea novaeangliae]
MVLFFFTLEYPAVSLRRQSLFLVPDEHEIHSSSSFIGMIFYSDCEVDMGFN